MEESSVYQAILSKGKSLGEHTGRLAGAKHMLVLVGSEKLGQPDPQTASVIDSIVDLQQLDAMAGRVNSVVNWQELLRPIGRSSRRRRT